MSKRRISVIATDVDGTLVGEGSPVIAPEYFQAIRDLTHMGVHVAAFTGRHIDSVRLLFEPVKDLLLFVCNNGALIGNDKELLEVKAIPEVIYRELIDDLMTLAGCSLLVTTAGPGYVPEDSRDEFLHLLRDEYRFDIRTVSDMHILSGAVKVSVYCEDDVAGATKNVREKWQGRLYSVVAGSRWVDFVLPEVNKGNSLRDLMASLDVTPEESIAFGDQMNDLGMIELAGVGIAVENAAEPCRAAADRLVPSWDRLGVLSVLEQIIQDGGYYEDEV